MTAAAAGALLAWSLSRLRRLLLVPALILSVRIRVAALVLVLVGLLLTCELLDVGVLALLVVTRIVLLDKLALFDHSAPGPRLVLGRLDERHEPV